MVLWGSRMGTDNGVAREQRIGIAAVSVPIVQLSSKQGDIIIMLSTLRKAVCIRNLNRLHCLSRPIR